MATSILLYDDESDTTAQSLKCDLERRGFEIISFQNADLALQCLESQSIDVVIANIHPPSAPNQDFLYCVKIRQPDAIRILLSTTQEFEKIIPNINPEGISKCIDRLESEELLFHELQSAIAIKNDQGLEEGLTDMLQHPFSHALLFNPDGQYCPYEETGVDCLDSLSHFDALFASPALNFSWLKSYLQVNRYWDHQVLLTNNQIQIQTTLRCYWNKYEPYPYLVVLLKLEQPAKPFLFDSKELLKRIELLKKVGLDSLGTLVIVRINFQDSIHQGLLNSQLNEQLNHFFHEQSLLHFTAAISPQTFGLLLTSIEPMKNVLHLMETLKQSLNKISQNCAPKASFHLEVSFLSTSAPIDYTHLLRHERLQTVDKQLFTIPVTMTQQT
ncbi:response regulator [Algicola sagamiensis]|uniref:response regulator n=1 Tax=Algicola sagamiensis TaxID=163869 RepID=UPI0003758F98|nr:response regulator [Algicola sagamiensis]